ncbi:hypothetical protein OC844_003393, partial [Tilletia horrida]
MPIPIPFPPIMPPEWAMPTPIPAGAPTYPPAAVGPYTPPPPPIPNPPPEAPLIPIPIPIPRAAPIPEPAYAPDAPTAAGRKCAGAGNARSRAR